MFRIMPKVHDDQPVQQTFENVKFALNSALLTFHASMLIDEIIGFKEMAIPFKIPYYIDPTSFDTTPMWKKGALTVDVSVLAQDTSFTVYVMGGIFGEEVIDILFSENYTIPAGPKKFYHFSTLVPEVDLTTYEGLVIAPEVPVKPIPPNRYVIMTQLTFRPFAPFAMP